MKRRQFLKVSSGGLLLGFVLPGCEKPLPKITPQPISSKAETARFNAFVSISGEGKITLVVPSSEMGQGVHTGLAQILAEELDADWNRIEVVMARREDVYKHPQMGGMLTGGSNSVEGWYQPLRQAGATARAMLVAAAAKQWGAPVDACTTEAGAVVHLKKRLDYGALATAAAAQTPPSETALKDPKDFRLIGQPLPRLEVMDKCTGRAEFGIDVVREGMVYAAVTNGPVFGSKLAEHDENAAKAVAGVLAVVPVSGGVAVVADSYWQARLGLRALAPKFEAGPEAEVSSQTIEAQFRKDLAKEGGAVIKIGDAAKAMNGAAQKLEVLYQAPFLEHATMEPMNCTAHVTPEKTEIWAPTQVQDKCAAAVMAVTGQTIDQVVINTTLLGGGFGRRLEADYVTQATEVSKAVEKPVKLIWSREETTQHGFYRPASLCRFRIGLDKAGFPTAWQCRLVGPSRGVREDGDDTSLTRGVRELPYEIPDFAFDFVVSHTPVPTGYWRSVSHSHTGFYLEGVMDEVAHAGGQDPLELRRRLLQKNPRHLAVLNLAAEKAGWGKGQGVQGLAVHESFGSIVAEVVELSLEGKKVKVHRVTCAVDCGVAINPDMIAAQFEGGVVFGLTAAFYGKITLEYGAVKESNFHDYKLTTMRQAPEVEVHIVPSSEPPGGIGEPPVPPLAPALVNALFRAGAPRIRSLPLKDHGFTLANL